MLLFRGKQLGFPRGQDRIFILFPYVGQKGTGYLPPHCSCGIEHTACLSASLKLDGRHLELACCAQGRKPATWFQGSQDALLLSLDHFSHRTQIRAAYWKKKVYFGLWIRVLCLMTLPKWLPHWVETAIIERCLGTSPSSLACSPTCKMQEGSDFTNGDEIGKAFSFLHIEVFLCRRLGQADYPWGPKCRFCWGEGKRVKPTWNKFTGIELYSTLSQNPVKSHGPWSPIKTELGTVRG